MRIGNLNKSKNLSKEVIDKIREKAIKRIKRVYSKEGKESMKKKSKPILLYNLDYTIYANYSSITEAAKSLNYNEKTIIRALKTEKNLLKKRWIVKYI